MGLKEHRKQETFTRMRFLLWQLPRQSREGFPHTILVWLKHECAAEEGVVFRVSHLKQGTPYYRK